MGGGLAVNGHFAFVVLRGLFFLIFFYVYVYTEIYIYIEIDRDIYIEI